MSNRMRDAGGIACRCLPIGPWLRSTAGSTGGAGAISVVATWLVYRGIGEERHPVAG